MVRNNRRRGRYLGAGVCVIISGLLLLLSVSLLYLRLNAASPRLDHSDSLSSLLTDDLDFRSSDDPIDLSDDALLDSDDPTPDDDDDDDDSSLSIPTPSSLHFFDHLTGVVRRAYTRRAIEDWEDYVDFQAKLTSDLGFQGSSNALVFGSDDVPVEDAIRRSLAQLQNVEDALLLKGSILREGWGAWFDKKTDFLRRDKMFRSNLEAFNPSNNPILQDPDGPGITAFTRGDKILINHFNTLPPLNHKSLLKSPDLTHDNNRRTEMKRAERRTLDATNEFSGQVHADGKRWGYYPALDGNLSFSNFMDMFLKGNCSLRVFMVWNSPSWAFGVRHKRGLETLLFHHPDACVVVFSETIELNFFTEFVEEGFKVAVVMPNLDELLKDTPTHIFASVWYEWKQTKYYPIHYSELIRLAALYKYGGVYLDSDIIVLKPVSLLFNTVGMEDEQDGSTLNGAVMASGKHSHFILECLKEFYASYDDTNLRWNGADLLSRVAGNLSSSRNHANKAPELMLLPQSVSFPISRKEIPRYFTAPKTEIEKTEQDILFKKILREYTTVHLWNGVTSALIPEPTSLVGRILNKHCIHCSDVL